MFIEVLSATDGFCLYKPAYTSRPFENCLYNLANSLQSAAPRNADSIQLITCTDYLHPDSNQTFWPASHVWPLEGNRYVPQLMPDEYRLCLIVDSGVATSTAIVLKTAPHRVFLQLDI